MIPDKAARIIIWSKNVIIASKLNKDKLRRLRNHLWRCVKLLRACVCMRKMICRTKAIDEFRSRIIHILSRVFASNSVTHRIGDTRFTD